MKKFSSAKIILGIISVFSINGCTSYKINNFEKYHNTNLLQNSSQKNLRSDNRATIILAIDDQNIELAKKSGLEAYMLGQLEKTFIDLKYVNVLDRNISKKIQNEMMVAELNGQGSKIINNMSRVPDYLILCKLYHVEFSSSYNENAGANVGLAVGKMALMGGLMYGMTRNGGSAIMIDASPAPKVSGTYTYTATISGNFKILKMPTFEEIDTIPFDIKMNKNEDEGRSQAKEYDKQLIVDASNAALSSSMVQVLQYVKPNGHIVGRKDISVKEPSIFRLSFGAHEGIKEGDYIVMKRIIEEYDSISKKNEIEQVNYIKLGQVTNVTLNSSWLKVKDKALAESLKYGDEVTVAVDKIKK